MWEQRTGADPHRFLPFYGNRSDMFLKVGWVWSEKTSKLKCCSRHIQHRTWKLTLLIVRWFARLHPRRMELVNIRPLPLPWEAFTFGSRIGNRSVFILDPRLTWWFFGDFKQKVTEEQNLSSKQRKLIITFWNDRWK